ncbi:MAG: DEAD/DEAH box helicase [Aeromonas sp.]
MPTQLPPSPAPSFGELGLSPHILRAVKELGYQTPTPIQAQAIPAILHGHDVLGGAQTGTGKTAGFTLPMLQQLLANHGRSRRQVRALILAPTRELAAQVGESVTKYAHHLPFRTLIAYGGVSIKPNLDALKLGVDILVATPGRVLDLLTQGALSLAALEVLVLDEADRMLDMGFIVDIRRIMKALPEQRQTLLFSATFSSEIKALADDLLNSPVLVEVDRSNRTAEKVAQRIIMVDRERRRELLSHMIGRENWQRVLVFVRTKQIADRLASQLNKDGLETQAIHGDKSQGARNRALQDFRDGAVRVLVATDIAARGLDISDLPHVVNFELPQQADDYIHRIGRTGRAGKGGVAISLVSQDERSQLQAIEQLIGEQLAVEVLADYPLSKKPTRQTLPGSKPVQNPPRQRGQAAAGAGKGNAKTDEKKPRAKASEGGKPAPARKREVQGTDTGFAPLRRLPKTARDSYVDDDE